MAAIGGASLGVLTGYQIMDQSTGEVKTLTELFEGGGGTAGPKGDKGDTGDTGPQGPAGAAGAKGDPGEDGVGITNITAAQADGTVTLTFTMSDASTKTATFDLPPSA